MATPTKEDYLIDHLVRWVTENINPNTGKAELHVDQQQLKNIDPSILEKYALPLSHPGDTVKFQLHRVIFKSDLTIYDFWPLFDKFEDIVDPSIVECIPIVKLEKGKLNQGDEFRWRVIPLTPLLIYILSNILASPITSLPQGVKVSIIKTMMQEISKRRFDVRIVSMGNIPVEFGESGERFTFTAQTLADHPYAARRSWGVRLLRRAYAAGKPMVFKGDEVFIGGSYLTYNPKNPEDKHKECLAETAEINTFPWLIDYTGEITTAAGVQNGGESARLNWERFLNRLVTRAAGNIVDNSLMAGHTVYGKANVIRSDPYAQHVFYEYPDIADEFRRVASVPDNPTVFPPIFSWKQIAGPEVELTDVTTSDGFPSYYSTAKFIAPSVNTDLTFEFTVSDNIRITTDRVQVTVVSG